MSYTEKITDRDKILTICDEMTGRADLNSEDDGDGLYETGVWNGQDVEVHYSPMTEDDMQMDRWREHLTYAVLCPTTEQIEDMAKSLYDGGWEPEDQDRLADEYGITEGYAQVICSAISDVIDELTDPIEQVLADISDLYSRADIDSDSEADAIIKQIDEVSRGIVVFPGQGFQAIAKAHIDRNAVESIPANEIKAVVQAVCGFLGQAEEMLEAATPVPEEIIATKRIRASGHSLVLAVTEEASMLRLKTGDIVEITIRRKV